MRRLNAASGPYAAELSASRPKIGMPRPGPICSARSSLVAMGLPTTRSRMFIGRASPWRGVSGALLPNLQDALLKLRRDDEPLMRGGAAESLFVTMHEEKSIRRLVEAARRTFTDSTA